MAKRVNIPFTLRGVRYFGAHDCAAHLGLRVVTVQRAIREGRLERLGLGRGARVDPAMPVRIRGVFYASALEAARALGVTRQAIYAAIERGAIDRVGLSTRGRAPNNGVPVVLGPMSFESMAAASRALGRADRYVSGVLRRGSPERRARLLAAAMRVHAERERAARRAA